MWVIRYVMIPIVLAGIAGFFAIAVVDRSFQHEQGQSNDPAFTEIFGTMTAAAINAQPTPSLAATQTATAVPSQTPDPSTGETNTANKPFNTSVPTQPVVPVLCPAPPAGWQLYTVQPGNTLFSLARETGTTVEAIRQVNCLYGELLAYSQIWLPNTFIARPEPPITITPTINVTEEAALPDLVNSTIDFPYVIELCDGECSTAVNLAVTNMGTAASGSFDVLVRLDPAQLVVVVGRMDSLAPGETAALTLHSPLGESCYDPDCSVCITVDSRDAISEASEVNNQYCTTFSGYVGGG